MTAAAGARVRSLGLAAAAAIAAVAAPGCGLGPGPGSAGEATLTVTHDYGSESVLEASESQPTESETVIRFLDREAELTTRYGGGFVQSIDGTTGELRDGRSLDWFFFVDGVESPTGAADVPIQGGDRIWWDYRDWTEVISTPAVVGSWPEPFLQASAGADRLAVRVQCAGVRPACRTVSQRLADEGVETSVERTAGGDAEGLPRLLVGRWAAIDSDRVAAMLAQEPSTSGVFARFERRSAGDRMIALDRRSQAGRALGPGAGLVAALREGAGPVTWVVTGTDARGVERAAGLLDAADLERRYAVAATPAGELALPLGTGGSG